MVEECDLKVCAETARREAKRMGYFPRAAIQKPWITEKNRRARLKFAKEHIDWSLQKWKTVLFSDESKFVLRFVFIFLKYLIIQFLFVCSFVCL